MGATQTGPKTIFLTANYGRPNEEPLPDLRCYEEADAVLRELCRALDLATSEIVHVVVVYKDLFIWTTNVSISRALAEGTNFIQHAVKADWEFNAGVRPEWWPRAPEADRMWNVHYQEDRANGRAGVARMRLERYDLSPVKLTLLPPH